MSIQDLDLIAPEPTKSPNEDWTVKVKEGVRLLPFDCSAKNISHQLLCNGKRIAISPFLADIVRFALVERSQREIQDFLSKQYPAIELAEVIVLCKTSSLSSYFEDGASGKPNPDLINLTTLPAKRSALQFKFEILSAEHVELFAKKLTWLFDQRVAILLLLSILIVQLSFPHLARPIEAYHHLTWLQWIEVWIGAYGAVLIHELGHSAACCRFGCKAGPIGFAFYWTIPILYSDTTDSWSLPRQHRMIVDLAGMYFHLVCGTLCIVSALICASPVLDIIAHSVLLSTIVNLNPFLRFDGYWLISDFTGIPNLRSTTAEYLRYRWRRLVNSQVEHVPPRCLPCSRAVMWCFSLYTVLSTLFFTYITFRMGKAFLHILDTSSARLSMIQLDVAHGSVTKTATHMFAFLLTWWSVYLMVRFLVSRTRPIQRKLKILTLRYVGWIN